MLGGQRWATDSGRPSSANSVGSGTSWEGDNGDFYSQMDENGIIGLNQAVEEGDLDGDGASEEEGSPISHQDPPEDQSFHLRDLQDSESTGGHRDALLYYDLDEQYSDSQVSAEDVDSWPIHRLAARNRQLDMTEDKRQEEEEALAGSSDLGEHSDSPFWGAVGQEEERDCSPLEHCQDVLRVEKSAVEHNNTEEEGNEGGALGDTLTAQPLSLSLHALPTLEGSEQSQGRSTSTPALQYLTTSPRFESKAYSESLCVAESCLESPCRPPSLTPKGSLLSQSEEETSNNWRGLNPSQLERPQSCSLQPKQELAQENGLEDKEEDDHEYEDEEVKGRRSEEATSLQHTPQLSQIPKPTYRNSQVLPSVASQCTHKAGRFPSGPGLVTRERKGLRTPTRGCPQPRYCQDSSQYRKGQLNYPLPDFSKVEPRVRFPKGEYKPPKGRGCPQTKGPASERPLVFKSPADIVREVLLSSGEAPPCSLVPLAPPGCTVLQEFRSPQQANVLVHQLQEDYNRLLTKYAEAENTIDRLRLEAKVNLYSDPPKPSHPDRYGTLHTGSKVITLTLPPAQRAELDLNAGRLEPVGIGRSPPAISTAACTSPHSLGRRFGEQLTEALSKQASRFHMQVDSFEELLRTGKLKPFEQLKALSCLAEGQDSLEKAYLGAREEHRLQQQQQQQQRRETGPFDPHREVEGEIFRSGMRLEELKDRVQPAVQVQPDGTSPPSPPPELITPGTPRASSLITRLESLLSPIRGGAEVFTGRAVISASSGSEGADKAERDEKLPSPRPWAPHYRHQHGEIGLSHLPCNTLNFEQLDFGRGDGPLDNATVKELPSGAAGIASGPRSNVWEADGKAVTQLAPAGPKEGVIDPPLGHSQQEPLPWTLMFPQQQGQEDRQGRFKPRGSSPASVGKCAVSKGQLSKPRGTLRRAPPQDGIVTPETDSGFVGSESSHLNLTALSSSQQVLTVSHSFPVGGGKGKMVSTQPHPSFASHRPTSPDCSSFALVDREVPPSTGKSREAPSSSPRLWPSRTTSEFGPESDRSQSSSDGEEEGQSVLYSQTANRQPHHQKSPPPADLRSCGSPFRVWDSSQLTDRHKAIQSLQAEMSRLREQLEGCLWRDESSHPITAPPLAQEDLLQPQHSSTPHHRFTQYQEGERRLEGEGEEEEETEVEDGDEEEMIRKKANPRTRSFSVPHLREKLDITSESDYTQPTSKPQSSRQIPHSSVADWRRSTRSRRKGEGGTKPVTYRGPYTGQQYSTAVSGGHDEVDKKESQSHTSTDYLSKDTNRNPTRRRAAGGGNASHHSQPNSGHCPLCQGFSCSQEKNCPGISKHRSSGFTSQTGRPVGSTHRKKRGVFLETPPHLVPDSVPLIPYVPLFPSVLYYSTPMSKATPTYSQPDLLSMDGERGRKRQLGHALLVDRHSLSSSLSQAIKAARHMRAVSRRMAHSLSTSLH